MTYGVSNGNVTDAISHKKLDTIRKQNYQEPGV